MHDLPMQVEPSQKDHSKLVKEKLNPVLDCYDDEGHIAVTSSAKASYKGYKPTKQEEMATRPESKAVNRFTGVYVNRVFGLDDVSQPIGYYCSRSGTLDEEESAQQV